MKIILKTKNLELTEGLQSFVEKKFLGLNKFINILKREDEIGKTLAEVFVEVEKETEHHKKGKIFLVKTQVILPGRSLEAWYRADDLFKAIVGAKNEMKMEIEKYKFRITDKNRREQRKAKGEIEI
jgi:ribosomal subunit interface protein